MNRLLSYSVLALCLLLAMPATPITAKQSTPATAPTIVFDGKSITWDKTAPPIVQNGTTYLPLRRVMTWVNGTATWNRENNTITVIVANDQYVMQNGSLQAQKNGQPITLSARTQQLRGQTYVPLRLLQDLWGYSVAYDAKTQRATIIPPKRTPSKGFFWEVTNGNNKMFLLGSIHVGDDSLYPIRSEIEASFAQSTHLVVEVNTQQIPTEKIQEMTGNKSTLPKDTSIKQRLTPEKYQKLYAYLKPFEIPEGAIDQLQPWVIQQQLQEIQSSKANVSGKKGIDHYYLSKATAQKKTILELETWEEQLSLLIDVPLEQQFKQLNQMIDTLDKDGITPLLHIWKTGNEKELLAITSEAATQDPESYKKLFDDRDAKMAQKLTEYLRSSTPATYFVVVGAGHLVGDRGVDALLREAGFEVVQK